MTAGELEVGYILIHTLISYRKESTIKKKQAVIYE
jgi:hypothetical protein